ncbi:MAG: hypothetical protein RR477_05435, partial [Raoultibacter sp.]
MTRVKHSSWLYVLVALALAFGGLVYTPAPALAATENINAEPSELQAAVEATALAYDEATKKVESLQTKIDENEARI